MAAYLAMVRSNPADEIAVSLVDIEPARHGSVVMAKGSYLVHRVTRVE
jgi:hypothetical protein